MEVAEAMEWMEAMVIVEVAANHRAMVSSWFVAAAFSTVRVSQCSQWSCWTLVGRCRRSLH